MQKFIQALQESTIAMNVEPRNTEAQRRFNEYRDKYKQLVGRRAVYYCKVERDPRVVKIIKSYPRYVLLEYKNYSTDGIMTLMTTCCLYSSLISGEDRLEME